MTSPLRQFLIIGVIGVTLTVASLVYMHLRLTETYIDGHLDSYNVSLARVLRDSILHTGLEQELVDGRHRLSEQTLQAVTARLASELRWIPIVKVKVYNPEGIVVFSSNAVEIGEDARANKGYRSAIAGVPASGRVDPDHLNEFDGIVEIRDLHQQYLPIPASDAGSIIGVFETYLDIAAIAADVETMHRVMIGLVGGVLALIYLALTATFLRTHRLLLSESRQREAHLAELRAMQATLEQRVAERTSELARAKSFLKSVIDGIANPLMVIRPDFRIELMNEKAQELVCAGESCDDRLCCYQVTHDREEPCCEPDHPCVFAQVRESGNAVKSRHRHQDAAGNEIILDLLTTPLHSECGEFQGVIEVQHDVTELVQIQEQLLESRTRLQATMDNVPDAILTCDGDFVIEGVNRSACALFDDSEANLAGAGLGEFLADCSDLVSITAATRRQTLLKPAKNREIPVELWIAPLVNGTRQARYILVIRDITGQIKAEQDLEKARKQYFHQEKMAAIGHLAAGIVHEVGNPIAAIAGAASGVRAALDGESPDTAIARNIEMIDEQITRLGKITRDIAEFASPRPREREMLDLNGLLESTARLLTFDRRFGAIGVRLDLDRNLPAIHGVADQLTQVFMNLLINAMDACAGARWKKDCIVLCTEVVDDRVHVCVRDRGTGMSAETLEHVTETFYTTKPIGEGTGLGLSLCDTIIGAHAGELHIESEPGKGTRVHVYLPIEVSQENPAGLDLEQRSSA